MNRQARNLKCGDEFRFAALCYVCLSTVTTTDGLETVITAVPVDYLFQPVKLVIGIGMFGEAEVELLGHHPIEIQRINTAGGRPWEKS